MGGKQHRGGGSLMGSRGCVRLKVGLWVIGGGGGRSTAAEIRLARSMDLLVALHHCEC